MKSRIMMAALSLLLVVAAKAQQGRGGGGPGGGDPVQRAEMQTKLMVDSLGLSTKQGEKVKEINLKYANKAKEARDANTDGDWEKMRTSMDAIRTEHEAELKKLLTNEQFGRWQKIAEEQQKHRGGPGGPGGGKGRKGKKGEAPPPPPPPEKEGGNN